MTRKTYRPIVVWHPGRAWGHPTIDHSRLPVHSVRDYCWHHGVEATVKAWPQIDRACVLLACFWAADWGTRMWKRRYKAWAVEWFGKAWAGKWSVIPDPPTKSTEEGQG